MPKQIFEIQVEGLLGDRWKKWFDGLTIHHIEGDQTLLTGPMDQAMLRGILTKIGDLGLNLVSVQQPEMDNSKLRKEAYLINIKQNNSNV